jgi:hypothetical protein
MVLLMAHCFKLGFSLLALGLLPAPTISTLSLAETDGQEREIRTTITVDGNLYLSGNGFDDGKQSPEQIWYDQLGRFALYQPEGVEIAIEDQQDPETAMSYGTATLYGKIVLAVQNAGEVEVSELKLMLAYDSRSEHARFVAGIAGLLATPSESGSILAATNAVHQKPFINSWHIAEEEVDRLGEQLQFKRPQIQNLPPLPDPQGHTPEDAFPWLWITLAAVVVVLLVTAFFMLRGRRARPA